jgi:DnaK suppressor protein
MEAGRARELLARERTRVEAALGDLAPAAGEPDDEGTDSAALASRLVDADIDAGVRETLRSQLEAIERAERRLAEGTYGLSVDSGEPIPEGRLEAIPWAERTAAEQARLDG